VGSVDPPGEPGPVAVAGGVVYLASGWWGVQAVGVSQPGPPTVLGGFATGGAFGLSVADGLVYVADYEEGITVLATQCAPVGMHAADSEACVAVLAGQREVAGISD
jgi:hypothetical protein